MVPIKSIRFWRVVKAPEDGRDAVREAVDQGVRFVKLFQRPRKLLMPGK